jgi:anti-sigma-K factor RskA/putative zinc finger protein
MPPKGKADLAHPQAADWVMGTLGPDEAVGFQLHLSGCPHCQAAVAEFGQLGQMLQHLPPAAEPPPGLEARTIASLLAAAAKDPTPTQVHRIPGGLAAAAEDRTATEIHPVSEASPAAVGTSSPTQLAEIPPAPPETGADEQPGGGMAKVIRFPRWHGRAGLLAVASAVAAAIIAAVLILPGLGGGLPTGAFAFKLVSPPGSGEAASGTATARPDASGSWDITLTVQHLKNFGDSPWYECWYVSPGHRKVASAGTFLVPDSGSGTFSMTSAVDPTDFPTMEITIESPNNNGTLQGTVVLSGQGKKL